MRRSRSLTQSALVLAVLTLTLTASLGAPALARAAGNWRPAYREVRAAQAARSVTDAGAFLAGDCRATPGAVICTR